ncbi:MAG: hypothetical protein HYZ63_04190 [Candidatus Andersenbacteria bacterium]|nr:hypothetical protein [Candidatus Andersenbacteria bacterium]
MADGQNQNDITGVEQNHLVAALSYLGILVLIPLLFVRKNDPFVKFHAKQGLVILLGFVIAAFGVGWIPVLGNLVWLILAIASIAGLVQSLQGKRWKIPVIGDLADKIRI